MPPLTDRQRVELAIPTRLLYGIAAGNHFSCFDASGNVSDKEGFAILHRMRGLLSAACHEPLADLPPAPAAKLARRIERTYRDLIIAEHEAAAARVALSILYFVRDLIESEAIILYDGSPVAEASDLLIPMVEYALDNPAIARSARKGAKRLFDRAHQGMCRTKEQGGSS